ncbi:hypothetical protein [Micromonospora sp. KC213]|nr:hypothetical protein [Micromonospora sp. KC213]
MLKAATTAKAHIDAVMLEYRTDDEYDREQKEPRREVRVPVD